MRIWWVRPVSRRTLAQRRRRQPAQRLDVGDGVLAARRRRVRCAGPQPREPDAVTAVGDELRFDRVRSRRRPGRRPDRPARRCGAGRPRAAPVRPAGSWRSRAARGVLVDAVDGVKRGRRRAPPARRQASRIRSRARAGLLALVGNAGDAGGLLDHDDVPVLEGNRTPRAACRAGGRSSASLMVWPARTRVAGRARPRRRAAPCRCCTDAGRPPSSCRAPVVAAPPPAWRLLRPRPLLRRRASRETKPAQTRTSS